jgi:hypothetical protein
MSALAPLLGVKRTSAALLIYEYTGALFHRVYHHDDWRTIFKGRDCNCNPDVTKPRAILTD